MWSPWTAVFASQPPLDQERDASGQASCFWNNRLHCIRMAPGAGGTGMMPPCAPHLMFRRSDPATPRAATPLPAAVDTDRKEEEEDGERRLKLSDLEWLADLGEGASGVVTKVRLRGTAGPAFALKVAHYPDDTDAGREQDEVLRRACVTGPPSPYVVRCHAVLRGDGGEPACLLELMDAGSLHDVLRRRRGGLPEPALAEVAARCALGLAHLHARGVAHLDLKPDNLLASARGDVKIADFGVSRVFSRGGADGQRRSPRVSIAVGTTAYMSPERFAPNAHAGPRGACAADVWSLGVTVLEVFLGHRPVLPDERTPSWKMLKEAICYGEPPSVPESAAASPELRGFVEACVQKDPRRRATVPHLLAHPFVARRDVEASRRALREIIVETM